MLGPEDFEECSFSGMMKYECSHCKGQTLGDEKPPVYGNLDPEEDAELEFEMTSRAFEAQYKGHCTINYDHKIRVGDRVARVQRRDNPMIPVSGVACSSCIREIPRAKL